jgi:hypothetical protein
MVTVMVLESHGHGMKAKQLNYAFKNICAVIVLLLTFLVDE